VRLVDYLKRNTKENCAPSWLYFKKKKIGCFARVCVAVGKLNDSSAIRAL
jgi:hypothetical protein